MTMKPTFFSLPLSRVDTNLLPPEARRIGSDEFKAALVAHFAAQYAAKGQQAVVAVDDENVSVLVLAQGQDPLDFIMTMLQSGRIQEAVPYLEALAKADANSVPVLYNLGIAYSELGQLDEAIIRLKKAVQLDPTHAHAWSGIGVAYQRMRKPEQALEALRHAVEADPSDGYSLRNYGGLLLSTGRAAEALPLLRAARKALPTDPQAIYGLALALLQSGSEDSTEEADELLQVLITRYPGSQFAELARTERTKLAGKSMRAKAVGGLRPDVVMYIASALDTFDKEGPRRTQEITFEVAMKGQNGLDINNPEQKYTLQSLPGKFSGLHLLSIMYAGTQRIAPDMDIGADLSAEYQSALAMHQAKQK